MRQSFRLTLPILLVLVLASGIVITLNAQSVLPLPRAFTQEQKLTASDGATDDYFGTIVAIDGDTAIIGAPRDDGTGTESGAAYIFVRDGGGVWSQQQKIFPGDLGADDNFGISVSISGDTVIVGAPFQGTNQGAAYVFTRSGVVWTQQQKLTTSDAGNNDGIGAAVKVVGDTA
ncbi:MAG: hypothetical protein H7X77_04810, partial [Anaerolineae bacterium]|nr:hypothetical protein [Anaerolineae bacterium]